MNDRFLDFKWDGIALGNYSHLLWNIAHGLPAAEPSGAAVPWFRIPVVLYLLAPLYRVWPSALFLPMVQAAALAAAAGTVFFIGSHYLSRVRALILTLLFCFYPPVYAMSSASFHPAILAVPFLAMMIVSTVRRREIHVVYFAAMALICDLRAGLLAVPILLVLAKNSKNRWCLLLVAAAVAAGYFGWTPLEDEEGMGPVIFYGALAAPYLFWGLSALENWADRALSKRSIFLALLSPVFFAGAVFASAIMSPVMMDSHPGVSQLPVRKSAMQTVLEKIPDDARVFTTPLFLPRLSNRSGVALLGESESSTGRPDAPKFALADLGGAGINLEQAGDTAAKMRELSREGWAPVEALGGVVLFSDQPGSARKTLFTTVDLTQDRPYLVLRAKAGNAVELVGFTMGQDPGNVDIINFSFYWRKIKKSAEAYAVQLSVVDAEGRSVYSVTRLLCYGLYPFAEWKVMEAVKDEFSFVVPERLQNSSYEVRLSLQNYPGSNPAPLASPIEGALDKEGRVRLIALDAI